MAFDVCVALSGELFDGGVKHSRSSRPKDAIDEEAIKGDVTEIRP